MRQIATQTARSQRQARVAFLLASGNTIAAASRSTGISRATIHRWMLTPFFRQSIDSAIADRKQAERDLIDTVVEKAANSLGEELRRRRSTASKVALIRGVLDLAMRMDNRGAL